MTSSTPNLRVETYREIGALPEAVLAALDCAEASDIEQGWPWLDNLVRTVFAADPGVAVHVLYGGDEVLAVLPIRHADDGQIWSLGNFYTSLYQPYFAAGLSVESLARLLGRIRQVHGTISAMRFAPMDVDGRCYQLLLAASRQAGLIAFPYFCFGNWHQPVDADWSSYFSARSSQLKNSVKRKSRDFQQAGGVLEIISDQSRVEFGISAYESVYAASWKVPEPYPEFVPSLIRMLVAKSCLRLGVATLGGRPIAAQIWIVAHGRASIFKLAYHEEFKRYSAGTLLTAALMAQVIDTDGVKEIDYLIGDDPYKASWMTRRRERWGIIAYNPGSIHGAIGAGREYLGRRIKPAVILLRNKLARHLS